jgi:hypothetical protein
MYSGHASAPGRRTRLTCPRRCRADHASHRRGLPVETAWWGSVRAVIVVPQYPSTTSRSRCCRSSKPVGQSADWPFTGRSARPSCAAWNRWRGIRSTATKSNTHPRTVARQLRPHLPEPLTQAPAHRACRSAIALTPAGDPCRPPCSPPDRIPWAHSRTGSLPYGPCRRPRASDAVRARSPMPSPAMEHCQTNGNQDRRYGSVIQSQQNGFGIFGNDRRLFLDIEIKDRSRSGINPSNWPCKCASKRTRAESAVEMRAPVQSLAATPS